jgi:twitching motility protein PilI
MARRDALRELQDRLAERLQRSREQATVARWLALECAGQRLLLALGSAGEIFPAQPLLPVPHTRPWFAGVANLRGQIHGVVDLAAFLGLRASAADAPPAAGAVRLVALNPSLGAHCALRVDRLDGLRAADQMQPVALPAQAAARPAFAGPVWADPQGRAWQEIDASALVREEQFLAVPA